MEEPNKRIHIHARRNGRQFYYCPTNKSRRHIYYIICIVAFLIALPVYAIAPESPQTPEIAVLSNNTLKPISTHSYEGEDQPFSLKYEQLLLCLGKKESGLNPTILGDHGTSIGCLQMHKWWESGSYWQEWCVRKYGFDDVRDCEQQLKCADLTLQEDFNQLYVRWRSTYGFCLTTD